MRAEWAFERARGRRMAWLSTVNHNNIALLISRILLRSLFQVTGLFVCSRPIGQDELVCFSAFIPRRLLDCLIQMLRCAQLAWFELGKCNNWFIKFYLHSRSECKFLSWAKCYVIFASLSLLSSWSMRFMSRSNCFYPETALCQPTEAFGSMPGAYICSSDCDFQSARFNGRVS